MGVMSSSVGRSPRSENTACTSCPVRTMKSRPFRPTATTRDEAGLVEHELGRRAVDLAVQPAGEPAVRGDEHQRRLLRLPAPEQRVERVLVVGLGRQVGEQAPHPLGVGPAAHRHSWARRIFEAAIIDIAFVIFAVFSTLRIRRFMSRTLGICSD